MTTGSLAVRPDTLYAKSGGVHIAYQTMGEGPIDVVVSTGWVTHLELAWDIPPLARFYERMAAFARVILFDKRGTGLSDPVAVGSLPTLEGRVDDVRAVMDAAGSERAALFGTTVGGAAMCGLFAAMQPDRVDRLILLGALRRPRPEFGLMAALGRTEEEALDRIEREWGRDVTLDTWAPSLERNRALREAWLKLSRASVSPRSARALMQMGYQVDWEQFLPAIHVPTLVLHRAGDRVIPAAEGRAVAAAIPNAKYVEVPGDDHFFWLGDQDAVLSEVQAFLTGTRPIEDADRVLATILVTDVVGSTETAARLGDVAWRILRAEHDRVVRESLKRYRGREIETAGDSFLATFDGPARAIRCARAIQEAVGPLGLRVRAGLHVGECEVFEHGIRGLAVNITARVAALAGRDEVLVTSTVKELVVGSGISFVGRPTVPLKGVPGTWPVFAVDPSSL